ncbi:MAG: protein kinase [Deltaproteobacteria bacterium]|nr:protein kinase [Deltaproteobacteria bacterium]
MAKVVVIGAQVREYVFQKLLGEGGMGSVYLAEHTILNEPRAIKVLHPDLTRHPAVVQRFLNEARAVTKLKGRDGKPHRNLVHVYELFQYEGSWVMVMERLEGSTLTYAIDVGPMTLDVVVHHVGGVANALKVAHINGIIHRDLKPDNVFITARGNDRSHIILLDFGVAQLRNELQTGPLTKQGTVIGTPHYMAPEQMVGHAITVRTDVFALGLLAYMMVTGGRHPWQYEDNAAFYGLREPEIYLRMTQQPPVDPRRYVSQLTDTQAEALLAPLHSDPAFRPASAAAFAFMLAERAPSDGVSIDGIAILREFYPELFELDDMTETVRSPRPASMPAVATGLEAKYRLVRKLGAGGMAEVFLATTLGVEGFARKVAIKRIFEGLSGNPEFARLFVREAQITARLEHPNIVPVIDFSRDPQDRLFLVMEYVDGKDLASLLQGGSLSVPLAIFITTEILRGLGYAHDLPDPSGTGCGIVHRDMSPHNVLLGYEGAVKICDFGLARARAASKISSHAPVGKPAYMSPEQVSSAPDLDGRSDLFAVGIMLHEMLTGLPLFVGSFSEMMAQVMFKDIEPPSTYRADIPRAIDAIVMRLLARDRNARYQRAEDAVRDLLGSGFASTDGRGDLVATMGRLFRNAGSGGSSPEAIAAMPPVATPSRPPTVSVPPYRPDRLPEKLSTASAAAGESTSGMSAVNPGSRTHARAFALAGVLALGGASLALVTSRSSNDDAKTQVAAVHVDADVGAHDASVTASVPALDAEPAAITPDAAAVVAAVPDAGVVDAGSARTVTAVRNATAALPTPETAPRQPTPPRAKGELTVSCDPWCEVWIDGVKRSSSAFKRFTLTVGAHTVRLVNPDKKSGLTKTVTITATEPSVLAQRW